MSEETKKPKYIWMDGTFVPFEEEELYCFRLREHYVRLVESMKIMHLHLPYTLQDHIRFLLETLRKNELRQDVHIRHEVLVAGFEGFGATEPVSMFIATIPHGRLFDKYNGIR